MTKPAPTSPAWNPYVATCPTRQVLDCIADKWAVLIIGLLQNDTHRFGEIRRVVQGVSQKMLTQTLRSLERNGLVHRQLHASVPPKVEYSLTPLGRSLSQVVEQLRGWSETHIEDVLRSRALFDQADPAAPQSR